MHLKYILSFFVTFFSISSLLAKIELNSEKTSDKEIPKIGNYSLPTSQQQGPLVGMGQNIVDKNDILLVVFSDQYKGKRNNIIETWPGFLYGISNQCSLYWALPFYIKNKNDYFESSGIQDIFLQLEYAYFTKPYHDGAFQSTCIGNITFPTGSAEKKPPTGLGSTSFFLGLTFQYQAFYWAIYTAYGATLTTKKNGRQFGNEFYYQYELEGIIASPPGWIFAWMLELDGTYTQRNIINNKKDPNSGSNIIFLTPSIWISSAHLMLQLGVGAPIYQSLRGKQNKFSYSIVSNFEWKF